jgi:hypothetical protein
VGCGTDEPDAVEDGDADVDADADTDADTDADPGVGGSIEIGVLRNGESACEAAIEFTGVPYTGECPGCDFAFQIDADLTTATGDACDEALPPLFLWTLLESPSIAGLYLGFTDADPTELWVGYRAAGEEVDFVRLLPEEQGDAVDYAAGELAWSAQRTYTEMALSLETCGPVAISDFAQYPGSVSETSDLPCDADTFDLWSFEAAGGYTYLTVDTVGAATAFNPWFLVFDDESCNVGHGDENFACTYGPKFGWCPSLKLPTEEGTYFVAIMRSGACEGSIATYELTIDTEAEPALELVEDDAPWMDVVDRTVSGQATVLP